MAVSSQTEWAAFDGIKKAVLVNACAGGQDDVQYHLCTDASKTGAGGVLFQLSMEPPGTIMTKDQLDKLKSCPSCHSNSQRCKGDTTQLNVRPWQ